MPQSTPAPARGPLVRALRVPLAMYGPTALGLAAFAAFSGPGPVATAGLVAAGFLLWTFIEYWLHRVVLHTLPRGGVRRYVSGRHVMHHRSPTDHPGIALLWVSATVAVTTFAVLVALSDPYLASATMAGIIAGYLSYEFAHLASHAPRPPLTPWGAALRHHHQIHHDLSARHNFAIVMPLWDRCFGTRWRDPQP